MSHRLGILRVLLLRLLLLFVAPGGVVLLEEPAVEALERARAVLA